MPVLPCYMLIIIAIIIIFIVIIIIIIFIFIYVMIQSFWKSISYLLTTLLKDKYFLILI